VAGTSAFAPSGGAWTARKGVQTFGAPRRDAQGYIIKEDLQYDISGMDVSQDLGSSAGYVELPEPVKAFIAKAKEDPTSIAFADTMALIEEQCEYLPNMFSVDGLESKKGENEGSNKIFSFARLTGLVNDPIEVTLALFGEYYQKDVLGNPSGTDHGNIRGAMRAGWSGVRFPNGISLSLKGRTFGVDTEVGVMLETSAAVIEGEDGWDPDSDCWIP